MFGPKRTKPAKHVFDDIYDLPEFWTDDAAFKRAKGAIWYFARLFVLISFIALVIVAMRSAPASVSQHVKPLFDFYGIFNEIDTIVNAVQKFPALFLAPLLETLGLLVLVALLVHFVATPWAKKTFMNVTGGYFDLGGSGRVSSDPERLRELGYFDNEGPYCGKVPDGTEVRYCRAPHGVHVLIVGPTGGGKTSAYILTFLLSAEPVQV